MEEQIDMVWETNEQGHTRLKLSYRGTIFGSPFFEQDVTIPEILVYVLHDFVHILGEQVMMKLMDKEFQK